MIDIHSHILPNIDDGSQSLQDSLTLLRIAIDNDITTQVLTPHIQISRYNNSPESLRDVFSKFEKIVKHENIHINLLLSAEVRIGAEVMALVEDENFPWLGRWNGKRAFLLEMPHNHIPIGSLNLVAWLINKNILPIIVHPERNREIQQDVDKLMPYIDAGCEIQITASSLLGGFGLRAKKIAMDLLLADRVLFMATDCHNLAYRSPDLKQAFSVASDLIGKTEASMLVRGNPEKLLGIN